MKKARQIFMIAALSLAVFFSLGSSKRNSVSIESNDSLRIEKVGTATGVVLIDGKARSRGFVFLAKQEVKFSSKSDYLRVTNLRTGEILKICYDELKNSGKHSVFSFIRTKYAAGKGNSDFKDIIERYPWYMIEDTIRIATTMKLDDDHGFVLKTIPDNRELTPIPFDPETNELVLTKKYFRDNSIQFETGRNYKFVMVYWALPDYQVLTDNFVIQYITPVK